MNKTGRQEFTLVSNTDNRTAMARLVRAYRQSRCVGVAVELGLADRLAVSPRTAEELAAEVGAHWAPLLLIERVLPEQVGLEDLDDVLADLEMLTSPGGQERTEAEYTALLKRAGFKLERTIPTLTPVKILESVPV